MNPLRIFDLARRGIYEFLTILLLAVFACASPLTAQNAPDNVALQIARLKSPDPELRRYAADALAKFADPRSLQPLIAALGDTDAQTRAYAAIGLGKLKNPQAVAALVPLLQDPDDNPADAAAMALGELKDPRAIAPLVAALSKASMSSIALVQMGPAAVEPLVAALKSDDVQQRQTVLTTLALTRDPHAIPAITTALQDPDTTVQQTALFALNALDAPGFPGALKAALKDDNAGIRANALRFAGKVSDPEITADIIAALHDSDPSVRSAAATYLQPAQTSNPQIAAVLITLVDDRDGSVSWGALNALATSRDPKAIDAMLGFAQGKDPRVDRYIAMGILGRVNDPRAFNLLTGSVRLADSRMAMIAAEQLGDLKDARAVPMLAEAVTHNVPNVASDALVSLGKIGSPAVEALIGLLNQPGLQNVAIGALANTKDPRAVPPLISLLQTPYTGKPQPYGAITQVPNDPGPVRPMTYSTLLSALGQLADPRAVTPLVEYMKNGPVGRDSVPLQLASIGPASIPSLIPLLHAPDENTRRLAAEALSDLAIHQPQDTRPHDALVAAAAAHDIGIMAGAYQFYVGLGAPKSEPDLVAALQRFPDQGMAEYFLNCGDVALEDAAIAWGQKAHFHITQQVYGVVWGQMPEPSATSPSD